MENKPKYVCLVNTEEPPDLAGKCFRVTGESEKTYSLEYHELVYSIDKTDCKEHKPS